MLNISLKVNLESSDLRQPPLLIPQSNGKGILLRRRSLGTGSVKVASNAVSNGRSTDSIVVPSLDGSSQEPSGLITLFQPEEVKAEIIFVHGLGGGSFKTWTHQPSKLFWPQMILPFKHGFENRRIHSFGYNPEWTSKDSHGMANIHDFGLALLNSLVYSPEMRSSLETPIIFVCYSMGGLVTKQAYLLALQQPSYISVAKRCLAMVFLATPHRGSDLVGTLNMVLKASGLSSKLFINDLERGSLSTEIINDQFRHVAHKLTLFSFYETRAMPIAQGIKRIVVEHKSAVLGYAGEGSMPLDTDHRQISKYPTSKDPNYISVKNVLGAIIANELSSPHMAMKSLPVDNFTEVGRVLGFPEKPSCGLGNFKGDKNTAWSPNSCCFMPGAGKSFTANQVARHLELYNSNTGQFAFTSDHGTHSKASTCLMSMASRISRVNRDICYCLKNVLHEDTNFDRDNTKEVWDKLFLRGIFQVQLSEPFYFVLDALDECKDAALLISLLLSPDVPPILRVFMTYRTASSEIRAAVANAKYSLSTLEMSPVAIESDTKAFIPEKMARLTWMVDDISLPIGYEVLHRSSGSFKWIKLVFEGLQKVHTFSGIREVLDGIPQEMAESYTAALARASQRCTEKKLLASSLAWIVWNSDPLTVTELQKLLEGDMGERVFRLKEFLEDFYGDFLLIDSNDRITFIHDTARKFLIHSAESDLLSC
ncbi:hypothetical protein BGZ60DRAFT_552764 [Tricladium varicosporioides]|nr:hypothetical protein BGZ60DRAFT_552764 [Hymenoscyphus varicosporioides]